MGKIVTVSENGDFEDLSISQIVGLKKLDIIYYCSQDRQYHINPDLTWREVDAYTKHHK